ncbi:hypothetical protein F5148DRAFT_987257 [Russula earlei]|uniref:Uncharacterized protein n=1 Tax=Russula earlei TaxID=71964 RepID=A0ACC0TWP2_9AGAM|nr:hypothetical protein F5148DRAFT_987257 [Russula earlei]
MVEVEVFLRAETSFLSIPHGDIERLAIFPFRWIRYVMYAICGARGDLTIPDGSPVDYDKTEIPNEDRAFVDYEGLNDGSISSSRTLPSKTFRGHVIRRDGCCVVTGAEECDEAHLIPRSKGDEVSFVVSLYNCLMTSARPPSNVGIDNIINGILLRKDLHSRFVYGEFAFIKAPFQSISNYGLDPEHIKRFHRGSSGPDYITLHHSKEPKNYDPTTLAAYLKIGPVYPCVALHFGANVDALFRGEGSSLPSTVILDCVYGVAAYKSWHSKSGGDGVLEVMDQYRQNHYAQIRPRSRASSQDVRRDESDLAKAMDELNMVLMLFHGIKPEEVAERRQKAIEDEERAVQEVSRTKVMEWRDHLDVG